MAQRHPTSQRRPGQTGPDDGEDVFVAKVYEASSWAQQNRLTLVIMGIVLAVVIVGVVSYVDYRGRLTEQATLELERIQQTAAIGDVETAKAELTQYLSRFDGTPYAGEARLMLAEMYLVSDQAQQAIETLEAAEVGRGDPLGLQIEELKGKAYEAADRLDQAEATFLRVADQADMDFQVIGALDDAARVREARGDRAGAAELYERILDRLEENDARVGLYEMRLAEARAAAAGGEA